jgi:hypothetical protein
MITRARAPTGGARNSWRYHYPHRAFPYQQLLDGNRRLSKRDREYDLLNTRIFDDNRYNGAGLGTSHQTGWTGLVAGVIRRHRAYPTVSEVIQRLVDGEECR